MESAGMVMVVMTHLCVRNRNAWCPVSKGSMMCVSVD